ncbi:MAG: copper amine oxidase N-terminal domain-containing protein [Oscillospiraceae bacterium]|nr:copper amine oxidase N-terminal domain-containing protein [Oscillospiraceae bacterium]
MFRKVLLVVLILTLSLAVISCDDNVEEPVPNEVVEDVPETPEAPEVPEIPATDDEEDFVEAVPPIAELPEVDVVEPDDNDEFVLYPVWVDGVGIPNASFVVVGDDSLFPTHVSLMALDLALSMDVFWNMQTDELSLMGLNGFVTFTVGSTEFIVEGETITLEQEVVRIDDEIYVPLQFFRDVYGAAGAYFLEGSVFIDTEETDMH